MAFVEPALNPHQSEALMGILLAQDHTSHPLESEPTLRHSLTRAGKGGIAPSFQDDLLSEQRLHETPLVQRALDPGAIRLEASTGRVRPRATGRETQGAATHYARVESLVFLLHTKEASCRVRLGQRCLAPCAATRELLAVEQQVE
jgi:hypothetical protein